MSRVSKLPKNHFECKQEDFSTIDCRISAKIAITGARMRREKATRLEILNGWKEIANYLGKGVRTVQRYERELALPIHRPASRAAGLVLATKAELDAWVSATPIRKAFPPPRVEFDTTGLNLLGRNVEEMKLLRFETQKARLEVRHSIDLLKIALGLVRPGTPPSFDESTMHASEPRGLANVLSFDEKKKKAS